MAIEVRFPTGGTPHAFNGSNVDTIRVFTTDTIAVDDFVLIQCTSEGNGTSSTGTGSTSDFPSDPVVVGGGNIYTDGGTHPTTHTITNVNSSGTSISTGWEDLGYQVGGYPSQAESAVNQGRNFNGCWVKKYTDADNPGTDNTFDVTVEVDTARDGRYLSLRMLIISGASVVAGDVTRTRNIALSAMKNSRGGSTEEVEVQWPRPTHSDYSSGNLDGNFVAIWTAVIPPDQAPVPSATLASGSSPVAGRTDATLLNAGATVSEGGHYKASGMNHSAWVYWKVYDGGTPFTTFDDEWNGVNGSRYAWDIGNNSIYGTMSGTIIFKEASSGGTAHARSFEDTSTASDTLTLTKATTETKTDTSTASDTLSAVKVTPSTPHTFTKTDSSTASDTLETQKAVTESSTDSSTSSDTLTATKASSLSVTDSATSSDALVATQTSAKAFTETDAGTAADTLTAVKSASISITDSATASDVYTGTKANALTKTDSSSAADTLAATKAVYRPKTDTSTASDTLVATQTSASTFTETDSSAASDTLTATKSVALSVTDSAAISDTLATQKDLTLSVTDGVSSSDTLIADRTATITITDGSSASDTLSVSKSSSITLTDSSTAGDELVATASGASTFIETDSSSSSDTLSVTHAAVFPKTDAATASDTLLAVRSGAKVFTETDTATSADTLLARKSVTLAITDSSTAADELDAQKSGASVFTKTDSSTTSDTLSATKSVALTFTDSSSSSDTLAATRSTTFTEADSSTASDTLSATKSVALTVTDSVAASDTLSATKSGNQVFSKTDSSSSSDTLAVTKSVTQVSTDSSTASDDLSAIKSGADVFTETDSSTASDTLSTTVDRTLSLADSAATSDTLTTSKGLILNITDSSSTSDVQLLVKGLQLSVTDSSSSGDSLSTISDRVVLFTDNASISDIVTAVGPTTNNLEVVIPGIATIVPGLLKEVQALAVLDIWNTALNTLGIATVADTVGSSPQQTLLTRVFPLFKKQFLTDHVWNGAKKTVDLVALTTTTTENAVLNRWDYAYQLPDDILRVWRLNGLENRPNHIGGNPNIHTNIWEIEILTVSGTKYRAFLTNQKEARIEYVFDVEDADISLLGSLTQHAMGMALAVYVATNFGKSANEIGQLDLMAKEAITAAKGVDGQEGTPQILGYTSLLGVRDM